MIMAVERRSLPDVRGSVNDQIPQRPRRVLLSRGGAGYE